MIRVKSGVFLANEKQVNLQKKCVGVQPFIAANRTKQKLKTKVKTLQEKRNSA
jgi:hypothetical protein